MMLFIGFISCQKDKHETSKITLEQSKQNVDNLATDLQNDLSAVYDENGWQAMSAFIDLMSVDDPVFRETPLKKSTSGKLTLKSLINPKNLKGTQHHVIFADYVGTYTWNAENQGWVWVQNVPGDRVIFIFPSEGPGGTDNNVTLTIYDYQEVPVTLTNEYGSSTSWMPVSLHADLVMEDTKYLELTFSASWNPADASPENLDIALFVKPYDLTITMDRAGNTASGEIILMQDDTRICSAGGDVTFGLTNPGEPVTFSGYIQYREVKLAGDVNIAAFQSMEGEPDAASLNENVDVALYNYPDGAKFADVEFKDTTDGMGFDIIYTDGTVVDGLQFLNELMTTMEDYIPQNPLK